MYIYVYIRRYVYIYIYIHTYIICLLASLTAIRLRVWSHLLFLRSCASCILYPASCIPYSAVSCIRWPVLKPSHSRKNKTPLVSVVPQPGPGSGTIKISTKCPPLSNTHKSPNKKGFQDHQNTSTTIAQFRLKTQKPRLF